MEPLPRAHQRSEGRRRGSQAHHRARRQAIQLAAYIGFALLGAVVCTVCDHLHATHGVLYYPKPSFWSQSWWVPLLFAAASLAVVAGAGTVRRLLRGAPVGQPTVGRVLGDLVAFVTAYGYTSFGHERPNVVLGVLVGFWLARVLGSRPRWVILFSIIVGIGGTAFESLWSSLGFFYYHHPDFAGVPRWLPGIYLHVAFLGASLNRLAEGAE